MLFTQEFYDIMKQFEKSSISAGFRKDKEDREYWKIKQYYQNGELNNLFIAYLNGYSYGKSIWRE